MWHQCFIAYINCSLIANWLPTSIKSLAHPVFSYTPLPLAFLISPSRLVLESMPSKMYEVIICLQ